MAIPSIERLIQASSQRTGKDPFTGVLLCFDPGETTGVAIFNGHELILAEEEKTGDPVDWYPILQRYDVRTGPAEGKRAVIEDYKIYAWKTKSHAWESLLTPRFIGAVELYCHMHNVPYSKQMAQHVKNFVTDDKLKEWGLYQKGARHARDAIRHGLFYLIFNHFDMESPK